MGAFDKAKDKAEQLKGKAEEHFGDATDNESLENEGRGDQLKGKTKEGFHDVREKGEDKLHDAKEHLTDRDGNDRR